MLKSTEVSKDFYPYFEKAGSLHHYEPNQKIYFQGDSSNDFYYIKSGRVRVYLVSREGREVTVEVVEHGRIFGESSFFSQSSRLTSVEAVNHVELVACSYESLIPYLEESPALLTTMFNLLAKTTRNLTHQVRRLCFLNAGQKIADFLLWMTEEARPEANITTNSLPYSHQEIAECTNLDRVTVTRLLNHFQAQGWVRLAYRKVFILNRQAMTDYVTSSL